MQDVLLIAHFTQLPGEKGNNRFQYIAEKINRINTEVEVVTSSFSHTNKSQRNKTETQKGGSCYKLTLLFEPGYSENVCLRRFYSHHIMGKNLKSYLKKRKKPDVIYCSIPSIDVAYVAAKYAKKNNVKFIIDVQDLWPEAFKMVFKVPILSDILFYPMDDFLTSMALVTSPELKVKRLETIECLKKKTKKIIVTNLMGYLKYLPNVDKISSSDTVISLGCTIKKKTIEELLESYGYSKEAIVTTTGEYAVRGYIIDIFLPTYNNPIRIEFFGDEIESIRYFNESTQLSLKEIAEVQIMPFNDTTIDNNRITKIVRFTSYHPLN
jgi:transcription-repair coupling factor (superfamily II helicase)